MVLAILMSSSSLSFAETQPAAPASASAKSSSDPFNDPLIEKVQARHQKAVEGDTKETKDLATDLEKWTKEQPTNYLLEAYLGSVYTLCSRDAWPGPGKLEFLKNGGKLMDSAVASAPENPAVRFIRAINYYSLPAIFGKRQTARDDFQILVKQVDGVTKTVYVLNLETQQAIYLYAGLSSYDLDQEKEAKDVWERGLKLAPASKLGVKIAEELKKVK